jgi:hypothetical protein
VSVENPLAPSVVAVAKDVKRPRSLEVQLVNGFVCDDEGLKVIALDDLWKLDQAPKEPLALPTVARLSLASANSIYVARATGFVAGGSEGLVILDLMKAREPRVLATYKGTAESPIDDARDVKVAMTNASQYAYIADGKNGLRVVQLTSADETSAHGWNPVPNPKLIATYPTSGPALAVSEGIDRDRAVDETGNQLGVFGRVGSRPFDRAELRRMLFHEDGTPLRVEDDPKNASPVETKTPPEVPGETTPLKRPDEAPPPEKKPVRPPRPGAGGDR